MTVEHRHLAGNAARQWLLIAERHIVLYCVKKSTSESVAILPQVWNSIVSVRLSVNILNVPGLS